MWSSSMPHHRGLINPIIYETDFILITLDYFMSKYHQERIKKNIFPFDLSAYTILMKSLWLYLAFEE